MKRTLYSQSERILISLNTYFLYDFTFCISRANMFFRSLPESQPPQNQLNYPSVKKQTKYFTTKPHLIQIIKTKYVRIYRKLRN